MKSDSEFISKFSRVLFQSKETQSVKKKQKKNRKKLCLNKT